MIKIINFVNFRTKGWWSSLKNKQRSSQLKLRAIRKSMQELGNFPEEDLVEDPPELCQSVLIYNNLDKYSKRLRNHRHILRTPLRHHRSRNNHFHWDLCMTHHLCNCGLTHHSCNYHSTDNFFRVEYRFAPSRLKILWAKQERQTSLMFK